MRLLAVLVAALVVTAGAAAHTPKVVGIGQEENKESTQVDVGDTVVVTLPTNPATGYYWQLTAVNRRLLRPDATAYVPALLPPLAQGATGIAIFVFKATAAGTTTLKLTSVSKTKGNPVGRRFVVTIEVTRPGP